ncbi:MAG: riboflavin biosynthesis protein RibF [Clostridia bacterium]|nr:riboflavin biosynthesis protein RibF [Clostridia bacterium]
MKIISLARADDCPNAGTGVALGMFDGVHMGHRRIITAAKNKSTELGISTSVLLFSSSPHGACELLPLCDRLHEMEKLGVHFAYVYDFEELRDKTPEAFVCDALRDTLHARAVFAGYNYHFGRAAAGDPAALMRLCAENGIECGITERVEALGDAVSSSRIRALLRAGDIETANALLTYPYYLRAPVLHGKALGRRLGLPTINQVLGDAHAPMAHGIYYTKTIVDGCAYLSVSNLGVRPTVEQTECVNVETHILDFDGDLYGKTVTVEFYGKGRGEIQFADVAALREEIARDCERARAYFLK